MELTAKPSEWLAKLQEIPETKLLIQKKQPHVGKYIPYMYPTGHVQVMLHMYDARWPEGIITVPFWEPNRHSLAKVCSCRVFFYRPPRVAWSSVPHTCDKNWSAPVSATGVRVCGIEDQTGVDIDEFSRVHDCVWQFLKDTSNWETQPKWSLRPNSSFFGPCLTEKSLTGWKFKKKHHLCWTCLGVRSCHFWNKAWSQTTQILICC